MNIFQKAQSWMKVEDEKASLEFGDFYCATRDVFDARFSRMVNDFSRRDFDYEIVAKISAIAGEIGNNSFDHNLGKWPGVMGIFFGFEASEKEIKIALADRGLGVLKTLKRVRPDLEDDAQALDVAFNEVISSRAPEARGNGLKFAKSNIKELNGEMTFVSGMAEAKLNHGIAIDTKGDDLEGCLALISFKIN